MAARLLSVLPLVVALLGATLPSAANATRTLRRTAPAPTPTLAVGPLLVLYARGGIGQPGPPAGDGQILALQRGGVARILARGLPWPFAGGLAPSPRGRDVAYGVDITPGPGAPAQTQGLWVVGSTGGTARHLLLPPPGTTGQPDYRIGPIAWSPDRYTLAYAVNNTEDYDVNARALGIWLTRYDRPHPRLVATRAGLGINAGAAAISQLSWSPDGRTLAVSGERAPQGMTPSAPGDPVVVELDVATGHTRVLVADGWYAAFAPTGAALAYVTGGIGTAVTPMALWVADAGGGRRRKVASVPGTIFSPSWSPDGQTIAYIQGGRTADGPTAIHLLDAATGRDRVLLTSTSASQPLFTPGGRFLRLAWMRARI